MGFFKEVWNRTQSAAVGAVIGAPAGPWGMAAGAAIGGATNAFHPPKDNKPKNRR